MTEQELKTVKDALQGAFLHMNAYADGQYINFWGRDASPNEVLANIYMTLAPAQQILNSDRFGEHQ